MLLVVINVTVVGVVGIWITIGWISWVNCFFHFLMFARSKKKVSIRMARSWGLYKVLYTHQCCAQRKRTWTWLFSFGDTATSSCWWIRQIVYVTTVRCLVMDIQFCMFKSVSSLNEGAWSISILLMTTQSTKWWKTFWWTFFLTKGSLYSYIIKRF